MKRIKPHHALIFVILIISLLAFLWTIKESEDINTLRDIEDTVKEKGKQINQEPEGLKESEEEKDEELLKINWQWVNNQKKLYESTPAEIELILKELEERFSEKTDILKALTLLRLDTPYQLGGLGEERGRDKDPIFRLDVTDCTAFVLTSTALLHSQNLEQAVEMMKFLNYRPKENLKTGEMEYEISFENRLHFTTDRNATSPYFQGITGQVVDQSKIEEKEIVLNRVKSDGKCLIDVDWEKKIVIKYIPTKFITKDLFQNLPEVVGVGFIKQGDEEIGLDIRHEGFLFKDSLFIHASSLQGKVVAEDFFDYYFDKNNNPRFDGILLFDIY